MSDPYAAERRTLVEAVTKGAGHLSPEIRTAIVDRARGHAANGLIPEALVGFVDRVAKDAPEIADAGSVREQLALVGRLESMRN